MYPGKVSCLAGGSKTSGTGEVRGKGKVKPVHPMPENQARTFACCAVGNNLYALEKEGKGFRPHFQEHPSDVPAA